MRALVVVFALLFCVNPVWAKEIAGVQIEEAVVNASGTPLQLNGAGIRKKVFFKIYIGQLYLQHPAGAAAEVIGDEGAKRVAMHFLYDGVGPDKIVEGWNEGFAANTTAETRAALQPRIDAFNAMFTEEMKNGDVMIFDYIPGQGTEVVIKGTLKGVIAGKDFNDALLAVWLGDSPVSGDLKKEMLGR